MKLKIQAGCVKVQTYSKPHGMKTLYRICYKSYLNTKETILNKTNDAHMYFINIGNNPSYAIENKYHRR